MLTSSVPLAPGSEMVETFKEDGNPVVSAVNGVRKNGSRFNSSKGFIYYKQKDS